MIQIAFEPAYDPYHTAFRFLMQARFSSQPLSIARVRIFDVFVLEPFRIERIRVPNSLRRRKADAAEHQRPFYGNRPSTQSLFNQMRPIQDAALQTLALREIISMTEFQEDRIQLIENNCPSELLQRIDSENEILHSVLSFLIDYLGEFAFDGVGGIKDRTQLGEFRYDLV